MEQLVDPHLVYRVPGKSLLTGEYRGIEASSGCSRKRSG